MIFWLVWGFFYLQGERLRFSVAEHGVVVVDCELAGVELVDFGILVLQLDFSFGRYFCLEPGDAKE